MAEQQTRLTDKARREQEEKEKRLAEALRANLLRRKSQARARADDTVADPEPRADSD